MPEAPIGEMVVGYLDNEPGLHRLPLHPPLMKRSRAEIASTSFQDVEREKCCRRLDRQPPHPRGGRMYPLQ